MKTKRSHKKLYFYKVERSRFKPLSHTFYGEKNQCKEMNVKKNAHQQKSSSKKLNLNV
jgi:hypothetical protein